MRRSESRAHTRISIESPRWRSRWLVGGSEGGGRVAGRNAGWAVAGVAFAMLALVVLNGSPGPWRTFHNGAPFGSDAEADVVAREVLTSHVRSLMPGHLMDVASTDQHTVKPWFNGRIDFSPPVNDFAADGIRPVGGRLDYLDGRQVAALVYQRRKHIVNVFVWPAADSAHSAVESTAHDGYNLLHWRRGGMNYWMLPTLMRKRWATLPDLLRGEGAPPAPHS